MSDCVRVCGRGGGRRRGGRREPGELEAVQSLSGRSVTCFPTNGDASSHSPGHHSVAAADNRGLDMIFSSAVSSACFLLFDFCLSGELQPYLTYCVFLAALACWWAQRHVCAVISQDGYAFLIKLACLITPFVTSLLPHRYIQGACTLEMA